MLFKNEMTSFQYQRTSQFENNAFIIQNLIPNDHFWLIEKKLPWRNFDDFDSSFKQGIFKKRCRYGASEARISIFPIFPSFLISNL